MITKQYIMDIAHEFNLPVTTIEKDYVLGWLLAGIANQENLTSQKYLQEIHVNKSLSWGFKSYLENLEKVLIMMQFFIISKSELA